MNHRWLGGMLTNWRTISNSIGRLRKLDEQLAEETTGLTKKETLNLTRERDKLERTLGGIREMGGLPDLVFVIDTNKEEIAKLEAIKLGIPLFAVIDSNSDPVGVQLPVPGNDDSTRAIVFYCDLVARAVLDGLQQEQASLGGDVGEAADAPEEDPQLVEAAAAAAGEAAAAPAEAAPPEGAAEQATGGEKPAPREGENADG